MSSLRPGKTAHLFPNGRAATAAFVTKRRFRTLRLTSSLPISQLSLSLLVELGGLGTVYGSRCVWWGNDFLWPTPGEPQVWLDERGWTCFSPPRRHILALPIRGQHLFFSLFFREGECFDYRFRRAIFPFLFRNTKVKLKQSCFTFGLTELDWLRSGWKKKWGLVVGIHPIWNVDTRTRAQEEEQKEVLFVFYHYLLSRKRRKGGRGKKKSYYNTIGRQVGADNYETLTNQICGEMGLVIFFFSFLSRTETRNELVQVKLRSRDGSLLFFFYFFRDRLENSAPSQIKEKNTPDQSFYFHSKCGQKENPNASSSPRAATEQLK